MFCTIMIIPYFPWWCKQLMDKYRGPIVAPSFVYIADIVNAHPLSEQGLRQTFILDMHNHQWTKKDCAGLHEMFINWGRQTRYP